MLMKGHEPLPTKFQETIKVTVLIQIIDQFSDIRDGRSAREHPILFLTHIDNETTRQIRFPRVNLLESEAGLAVGKGNNLESEIFLKINKFVASMSNFFLFTTLILGVNYT